MGYCSGNLCVHKGGASMSHIQCGSLLKRAVLRSSKSQVQITHTTHAAAAATPSSFAGLPHPHAHLTLMPVQIASASVAPPFLHNRRLTYCVEKASSKSRVITYGAGWRKCAIHRGAMLNSVVKQLHGHGFMMWRAFSSASDIHELMGGSNMLMHVECSSSSISEASDKNEDFNVLTKGSIEAKNFVVVVESPTKAKTIEKYLGPEYIVLPTYGHVRDLAARAGSVRPDDDYAMVWEVPEAAQIHVTRIKKALKGAKCLILASDPDREGEAIAWHVSELLKAEGLVKNRKPKVVRVTFNEITKASVLRAMQAPRDICSTLVTAYLARRALDHLIGFALSPVLWRKLPGSRSAGRVQSVALKLVCEREKEIEESVQRQYWTVEAYASLKQATKNPIIFPIRPTHFDGKKIEKFSLGSEDAKSLSERLSNLPIKVSSVQKRSKRKNPLQPYITSTLQMDAQAKLGYGAMKTMTLAQRLYEGVKLENEELTGLITYMRTDGLQLSSEAVEDIRALAAQRYGDEYVPKEHRKFNSKVKNAQEAHEAIRPTDVYRLPSQLCDVLEKDALRLYTLIWRRTMACQMEQAGYEEVSVDFVSEDGSICLQAFSSFLSFPGFMAAMEDKQAFLSTADEVVVDDSGHDEIAVGKYRELFHLKKGDVVFVKESEAQQHSTRPPARYSEGLLVKAMEELGIGRPSTYATMLKTLESRKYVKIEHHRIIPEVRGRMVATFLSHFFPKYIDYSFTAHLEEQLDEVSGGQVEWKQVLKEFWPEFESVVASSIKIPIQEVIEMLQESLASHCFKGLGINGHSCPSCGHGKLTLKLSRYGSGYFFGCNSYPDCSFKAEVLSNRDANLSLEGEQDSIVALKKLEKFDVLVGVDPDTNLEVRVKKGPFGHYIQLGHDGKQRRCFKLPEGVSPTDLTLERAKEIMKYPMILGKHPEDGEHVTLGIGRNSFYIRHRNALASVPKGEVADDVTLERAIELLKGKGVTRTGRKSRAVLAAEENERNLQERKARKKAPVVAVKPKAKKVTKLSTNKTEEGESRAENPVGVVPKTKVVRKRSTVKAEEGESKAENLPLGKGDELVTASERAKKSTRRKKATIVTSEEVSLEVNVASPTMLNEVTATDEKAKTDLGGKRAKIVVDDDDQRDLEAKEPGILKREAVAASAKQKVSTRGKSTQTLAGVEKGNLNGKSLSKQVKIEVVPPVKHEAEGNKSTRQKKEKVLSLGESA
eukprot:c23903_g1_i1 orf=1362-5036(-)